MTADGTVRLVPEQEGLGDQSQWGFRDVRAVFVGSTATPICSTTPAVGSGRARDG
jgi:hypothetical protein